MDKGTYWSRGKIIYFTMDPDNPDVARHVGRSRDRIHSVERADRDAPGRCRGPDDRGHRRAHRFRGSRAHSTCRTPWPRRRRATRRGSRWATSRWDCRPSIRRPAMLPGRSNLIEADGIRCLIDYAHNVPALSRWNRSCGSGAGGAIGVASAPGNRRDDDLAALGAQLARMHDDRLLLRSGSPRGANPGRSRPHPAGRSTQAAPRVRVRTG